MPEVQHDDTCAAEEEEYEIVEGEPVSPPEQALIDSVVKSWVETVPRLNEYLGRIATLAAAFIGGGFVMAKGDTVKCEFAIVFVAVMTLCLCSALLGLKLRTSHVEFYNLAALKEYRRMLVRRKNIYCHISTGLFFAGILIAFVGLIAKRV